MSETKVETKQVKIYGYAVEIKTEDGWVNHEPLFGVVSDTWAVFPDEATARGYCDSSYEGLNERETRVVPVFTEVT